MANRFSRVEVGIPSASYDGRYYGRYPHGDKPNNLLAANAASSSSATGSMGADQIADWNARSTAPGVIWAHNFDGPVEVTQFQNISGAVDPTATGTGVNWVADGFAGGGCLELVIPTGGTNDENYWQRPMSALLSGRPGGSSGGVGGTGNGRTVNDPAAGGTITKQTWDSSAGSEGYNWRKGYYAHPTTQSTFPQWPVGTSGVYDGSSFYFSLKVKIQSTRWTAGNPAGKLLFIDLLGQTGHGEILTRSVNNPDSGFTGWSFHQTNPYLVYTSQGNLANSIIMPAYQGNPALGYPSSGPVENGAYVSTCTVNNTATAGHCWEYPSGDWAELLFYVQVGQDNEAFEGDPVLSHWSHFDQIIKVWKCDRGETAWTPIFDNSALPFAFTFYSNPQSGTNGPNGNWNAPGYNGISPSIYMNGVNAALSWYQRYTQMIFSQSMIAAPQAW